MATTAYKPVPWPRSPTHLIPDYRQADVMGVGTSADGKVYVVQRSASHPVLIFDRNGNFVRSWGAGQFTAPHGCRVDSAGNVWLTDNGDHRVMKWTADGRLLATYGVRNHPGADARHFNRPADVAFSSGGDVYIADGYGNARVVRLSPEGNFKKAWGRRGTGQGEFHLVHSIAVDKDGLVYVADRENARLQIFTPEGRFMTEWRQVAHPFGLDFTPEQNLVISDGVADTISIFNRQGKRLARWGGTGTAPGKFRRAHLLSVDRWGAIYVAEVKNRRVQKFVQGDHS